MAEIARLDITNRHPVDELADVRAAIRRLQDREAALRELIISKKCERQGDEHTAFVVSRNTETLDKKRVMEEFGRERLRKFLKTTSFIAVKVERNG